MSRLLRGKGADLGSVATRFPLPERTMLHVLGACTAERPDRSWLVFDRDDGGTTELTYGEAQRLVNRVAHSVLADVGGDTVSTDAQLDLQVYRDWLEQQVPRYMVPRYLELRAELPKSASAKIQKHLLAEAPLDRPAVHVFEPAARAR